MNTTVIFWKESKHTIFLVCLASVFLVLAAFPSMLELLNLWEKKEEYSHGYLIPVISLFLVWQVKNSLEKREFVGSWLGFVAVLASSLLLFVGNLSTLHIVVQYAVVFSLVGLSFAYAGMRAGWFLLIPCLYLIFMIPLPPFLYNQLSGKLQIISSELGVLVIRSFGISVYLEGNVIDLGSYKLQVVEACNGLRYLFPLTSFGFLCAYLFKAPIWQRTIVFLSTMPVTVFMNSFRIGVIGVLVDNFGQEQAEGFLHDFEGWVIFMACLGVLFIEMWVLTRFFRKDGASFSQVFGVDYPAPVPEGATVQPRYVPKPLVASCLLMLIVAVVSYSFGQREEIVPERVSFVSFPDAIENWNGRRDNLETIYLDALKLDDYIISDYQNDDGDRVNFYVAWYDSQKAGTSAHSPRSCIPGGGWKIQGIDRVDVGGQVVNRTRIQMGDNKQLVYYWFQQRGRVIASEYMVKWYLFWDSLTRNRSDGALVRYTTALGPNESWEEGDERIKGLIGIIGDGLSDYVPE